MSELCKCSAGLGNLGTASCVPGFGIGRRKIFVPLVDNDGLRNSIDPSVTIDDAFLLAKLNETDPSKRWYLSPVYQNGQNERADSEFEEAEDGTKYKIRTGVREENLIWFEKDTTFLSKLAQNECVKFGQFTISDTGSLLGRERGTDGLLYPIAIQGYDPNWNPKVDTAVEKVMLKFDWVRSEEDKYVRYVNENVTVDFGSFMGLLDVNGTLGAVAALGFTFTARLDYGSFGDEILHTGLLLADLTSLTNVTTATVMTITSITEVTDGVYDVVYTGATAATDVLSLVISKDAFDYAGVTSMEIVY